MNPHTISLSVPFRSDAPWVVQHEVDRVGTYPTRDEAISAAVRVRAKLVRAWGCPHPPVRVQESDGSWHELKEADT